MTGIATTAIAAFFVASGLGTSTVPSTWADITPQAPIESYSVTMTGYNAVPEQTDESPDITASGAFSDPDIVAARSRDLADELPFGTVIAVRAATSSSPLCGLPLVNDVIGLRVIADTMNARMHKKVDILFDTDANVRVGGKLTNAARVLGVCKGVAVEVVGHIDIRHMPKNQLELKVAMGERTVARK